MNFSRKGSVKALQYDGDNYFEIMGMFKEHGRPYKKKDYDTGKMQIECHDNKVTLYINHSEVKKGYWVILDEHGWLSLKNNKIFKQMFYVEKDIPITRTIKKTVTKKATKSGLKRKGK